METPGSAHARARRPGAKVLGAGRAIMLRTLRASAGRLYEHARGALPGQGTIERTKLKSTKTPRLLWRPLDARFSCRYRGVLGLRFARRFPHARRRGCGFFPAHPMPPPAPPALVLAVYGPHWLCMHQPAPEIRDSRSGRFHRSTFLTRRTITKGG